MTKAALTTTEDLLRSLHKAAHNYVVAQALLEDHHEIHDCQLDDCDQKDSLMWSALERYHDLRGVLARVDVWTTGELTPEQQSREDGLYGMVVDTSADGEGEVTDGQR